MKALSVMNVVLCLILIAGVGVADPPITIRVNNMTLRSVLNHLAIISKIKWELKDEAICLCRS